MSNEDTSLEANLQPSALELSVSLDAERRLTGAVGHAPNDRKATAELLVDEHAVAVGRLCMALLGSQAEAEDALQETLLSALVSLESFRGEGTLRAWLFGIARRKCARQLEARAREREKKHELGLQPPALPEGAERATMARRARRLLEEIKPTEREAVVLRFAGELSFRELGQACGIEEAAARKRVSRGLSRLRTLLGEAKS